MVNEKACPLARDVALDKTVPSANARCLIAAATMSLLLPTSLSAACAVPEMSGMRRLLCAARHQALSLLFPRVPSFMPSPLLSLRDMAEVRHSPREKWQVPPGAAGRGACVTAHASSVRAARAAHAVRARAMRRRCANVVLPAAASGNPSCLRYRERSHRRTIRDSGGHVIRRDALRPSICPSFLRAFLPSPSLPALLPSLPSRYFSTPVA